MATAVLSLLCVGFLVAFSIVVWWPLLLLVGAGVTAAAAYDLRPLPAEAP